MSASKTKVMPSLCPNVYIGEQIGSFPIAVLWDSMAESV